MVAPLGGIWAPAALRRSAAYKASKAIRAKLASVARPVNTALEPAFARTTAPRQPIHPAAVIRQQKNRRWHSTSSTYQNINAAVRRFISTGRLGTSPRIDRTKFLSTQTGRAISQFAGRAPFASTLRPNLTGGALPRTAGGYGLGSGRLGGARYFSHVPAAQAQVVQNVSAAVRAFWISGQKAQYDGLNAHGERSYRAVSVHQDALTRKLAGATRTTPGSYVDFRLSPTITALSPLAGAFPFGAGTHMPPSDIATLNAHGLLDVLSVDFAHALQELTATLSDLQKLSSLGDLPIQLEKGHTVRVRFPGVDAETVESLCLDLQLTRGLVGEDAGFETDSGVAMALQFPFAPGPSHGSSEVLTSSGGSLHTLESLSAGASEFFDELSDIEEVQELASPGSDGYGSMPRPSSEYGSCSVSSNGVGSVYRFLEECDRAQSRL